MENLHRLLSYTKNYWKPLAFSMFTASLFGIVSAAPTYILKQTIDEIFIKKFSHLLTPFIIGFIAIFFLKALFMYLTSYYMNWVGTRVVNDIRLDFFKRIIHFPISFFQKNSTGHLMAHFLNDIQMIQNGASVAIKDGIRGFFEAICLICFAFFQNWQLALLMMVVSPVLGYVFKKMGSARKLASTSIQKQMGSISSMLQESIIGVREIKAFNAEEAELSRFKIHLDRCFSSIMHNIHVESLAPALVEIIAVLGGGLVFYVAIKQVLVGIMTAGQLTAFIAAVILAYQPLKKIIAAYSDVQYSLAAADRIFVIMDKTFEQQHERTEELSTFSRAINLNAVSFNYDNIPVLTDASLSIKKGECIGIIGQSGSGKSTLCDLLLGFITPASGSIFIDNIDITKISLSNLRDHIGYVSQRTFLFNDTIYNNVAYARPEACEDEIIAACKAAHADEFIQRLHSGYQTIVGENGTLLSGGQKQRLTIARALLKDPEILIFDEATSSLDQESELMIRQAIQELRKNKTLIIISHRPLMLENVDRIFMIQDHAIHELSRGDFNQHISGKLLGLN